MQIVPRIKYPRQVRDSCPRVLAFVSLELDGCFVVEDCRWVETTPGRVILAMPERVRERDCPVCGRRMPVSAGRCGACDAQVLPLLESRYDRRALYACICFPTNPDFRAELEAAVRAAYQTGLGAGLPEGLACPASAT